MSEVKENEVSQNQTQAKAPDSGSSVANMFKQQTEVQQSTTTADAASQIAALESVGYKSDNTESMKQAIIEGGKPKEQQSNQSNEAVQQQAIQNAPEGAPNNQNPETQAQENQVQKPTEENKGADTSEGESLRESQNPNEGNPYFLDSEIYGGKHELGSKKREETQTHNFELPDEVKGYIKSNYGFEDFSSLESDYKEKSKTVEELSAYKDNYERVATELSSLPPDLQDALETFSKGEDYTRVFNKPRLNFNVDFQDQDKKKMIDYFFPGELKEDDWSAADPNSDSYDDSGRAERMIDRYIRDARDKFDREKDSYSQRLKDYSLNADTLAKKRKESIETSMKELNSQYDGLSNIFVNKVYDMLDNGGIERLFKNPDGTYKPEAASLYLEAVYGKDLREQLIKQATERATSKANEKILETQASSRPEFSGTGSVQAENPTLQKARKEINKLNEENFY